MNSILEIKNLSFGYTKDKLVLEDLNIQFNEGEIIALLGKNGCGKSTLLDCIIGANQYQGFVFVDGINSKEYSEKELAKKIAYIPQNLIINIDYSVRDFISFPQQIRVSEVLFCICLRESWSNGLVLPASWT